MDVSEFARLLTDAIAAASCQFRQEHPNDSPYAIALVLGQCGNYLGCAIATEEGLLRVAERYDGLGYRYRGWEWEVVDNREKLATWLRWANPDDGWHFCDFPPGFQIDEHLIGLVGSGAFGDAAEGLEEFCTETLNSMHSDSDWQSQIQDRPVIVGVTAGEDPRDFLRTATRCNPWRVVQLLWLQYMAGEALNGRIQRDRATS